MFSADLGVNQVASTPAATNPPFQKVALLLHGDGTNGAQNNTFLDSSTNNFTITRTGNVAQGTFSPFSLADGQWSNYFGASDAYFVTSSLISLSGNFTLEAWVYRTANDTNYSVVWNDATANVQIGYSNTGAVIVYLGGWVINNIGTALSANTWHHYAIVRSGTTVTAYVDGVSVASGTSSYTAGVRRVGGFGGTGYNVLGYLSNVRVTNTAVYSSAFTPPTNGLTAISGTQLLICQSNRFVDNSSNNYGLTLTGAGLSSISATAWSPFAPSAAYSASTNGGSGYFDGSGDYLSAADNSVFVPGTSDFTVEFLMYTLSSSGNPAMFTFGNYANGIMVRQSNANLEVYIKAVQVYIGAAFKQNAWTHIAISRTGTSLRIFADGVQLGTTITNSANINPVASSGTGWNLVFVGAETNSSKNPQNYFLGYLSNVRYVVGTAVYTANFTPPTAPLTAVANTQLLLNCVNAGIYDNAGKNDIETVGNAQISTSVKKYGTGSMYFDGTGDYLLSPPRQELYFGSGDFTMECWLNLSSIPFGTPQFIVFTSSISMRVATSGVFQANCFVAIPGTTVLNTNTWYHVAATRSGNTVRVFVNGILEGQSSSAGGELPSSNTVVGANSSFTQFFNGYIDDLRITKGQALYTSNFTPPTQAFPNV